ncbi:hypothetical protein EJ110_NYTH53063 [Nymphaea thermarum]|nr:hypothetical protein EJ110_NYTH53063 [Nymphaea thermarum]
MIQVCPWLAQEDDYHNADDYEEEQKKNTLVDCLTLNEKNKDLWPSSQQLMEMTYMLNQFKSAVDGTIA